MRAGPSDPPSQESEDPAEGNTAWKGLESLISAVILIRPFLLLSRSFLQLLCSSPRGHLWFHLSPRSSSPASSIL